MHLPLGMALLELVSFLWLFQTSTHALVQGSKTSPHAPNKNKLSGSVTSTYSSRVPRSSPNTPQYPTFSTLLDDCVATQRKTCLAMGLLDSFMGGGFLKKREGDFIKIESSDDVYGPGPMILLWHVPSGITDEEIRDMIEDEAPRAFRKGVDLIRMDHRSSWLDLPKQHKRASVI